MEISMEILESSNELDFFVIPPEFDNEMTEEEFCKKLMTSNTDISIENVKFMAYPQELEEITNDENHI